MVRRIKRANPVVPRGIVRVSLGMIAVTALLAIVAVALASPRRIASFTARSAGVAPAGCPDPEPSASGLRSARSGANTVLVPGTPTTLLLCRYEGLPEPGVRIAGFGLVAAAAVSAQSTVATFASALNRIPPTGAHEVFSCPMDEGAGVTAWFRYASGPPDPVDIGLQGCETISNGQLHRLGLDAAIVSRIQALLPITSAFVSAHEATITGTARVCGGTPGPCRAPSGADTEVQVFDSSGYQAGFANLDKGNFAALDSPGHDRVELVENSSSGSPKVLDSVTATGVAGRDTRVELTLRH
jgi:hypothetical protein